MLALFWKTSLFTVLLVILLFPETGKLCCTGNCKHWRSIQLPAYRNLLSFQVPCDICRIPTGLANITEHLAAYDLCHSGVEPGSQVGCLRASQTVQDTCTDSSCWCLSCWKHIRNGELSDSRDLLSNLHNAHLKKPQWKTTSLLQSLEKLHSTVQNSVIYTL